MQEFHSRSIYALMALIKRANEADGKRRNVVDDEVKEEIRNAYTICETILAELGYSWPDLEDLVRSIAEWDDLGRVVNLDFLIVQQ
jgi:hypothetical protein